MPIKYGTDRDPYCYDGTEILINRLNIRDTQTLEQAELELSTLSADEIEFELPSYDLSYWKEIYKALFGDLYDWADLG